MLIISIFKITQKIVLSRRLMRLKPKKIFLTAHFNSLHFRGRNSREDINALHPPQVPLQETDIFPNNFGSILVQLSFLSLFGTYMLLCIALSWQLSSWAPVVCTLANLTGKRTIPYKLTQSSMLSSNIHLKKSYTFSRQLKILDITKCLNI